MRTYPLSVTILSSFLREITHSLVRLAAVHTELTGYKLNGGDVSLRLLRSLGVGGAACDKRYFSFQAERLPGIPSSLLVQHW